MYTGPHRNQSLLSQAPKPTHVSSDGNDEEGYEVVEGDTAEDSLFFDVLF